MADDPSFAQKTAAFLAWFTSQPGTTFHKDIEIRDLRAQGAGRGIIATQDIPPDTTLFTIPRSAIISAETSPLPSLLPAVFNPSSSSSTTLKQNEPQDPDPDHNMDAPSPTSISSLPNDDEDEDDDVDPTAQDSWTTLILILIHQHLQGSQTSTAKWQPYLDILPAGASAFTTPMFWSTDELAALQASPVAGKVGREEAEDMIRSKIIPVIRAHEHVFFPCSAAEAQQPGSATANSMSDDELLELGFRMGSVIMAYAFDLEKEEDDDHNDTDNDNGNPRKTKHNNDGNDDDEDDETSSTTSWIEDREGRTLLGMVPMADLLNADASFNAHIEHGEHALTATSLRTIPAGAQILNYYGPLSNGELLRRYGYVTTRHRRWNLVDLPWAAVRAALRKHVGEGAGAGFGKGLSEEEWDAAMGLLEDEEMEEDFVVERGAADPDEEGRVDDEDDDEGDANNNNNNNGAAENTSTTKKQKKKADVPEELTAQLKEVLKAVKKVKPAAVADKVTRDRIIYSAVASALEDRMRQYGTTLEHDLAEYERAKKLIADGKADGHGNGNGTVVTTSDQRKFMALDVRIGEKVLLKQATEAARARLAELEEAARDGDGRSAKRRRI
ncbi:hypothetical protein BD289DRAFT_94287 [Coniella lustricola]|uniref:SET domain-containing protein n=1 Tax=Coniella lustricola TaxID=2025994 RepID=A0A2T2ZYF1_9PEZI|nr:hypothetical protein BD289DRAFT_94287 [Coniella lustricola]